MNLAEQPRLRMLMLCALYVAQGIPYGFMATTLVNHLAAHKVDETLFATVGAFATLPYSFKWIWGPVIDSFTIRRFGRRRPWILLAQLMMASTVLLMVTFDVTKHVQLAAWVVFIHTVFNSLQDVSVDALAIDLLDENERGRANGLTYACKYGGVTIGGTVMSTLIASTDIRTALVVQAAILLAIGVLPLLAREPVLPVETTSRARHGSLVRDLVEAFSVRSALLVVVVLLVANFSQGMLQPVGTKLFIGELRWKQEELTAITGGWGTLVGGGVAMLAGLFIDRAGKRRMAVLACCALAINWIVFAHMRDHWSSHDFVRVLGLCEAAMVALLTVSMMALCMDVSWSRVAASQFAAYMAVMNLSTVVGTQFGPVALKLWSYKHIYMFAACLQIAAIPLIALVDPTELRRTLPRPEGARSKLGKAALLGLGGFLVAMTVRAVAKGF